MLADGRPQVGAVRLGGSRSFEPANSDLDFLVGFDPLAPGFFWFAGQGGFGIQTAPAAALIGAALATGAPPPEAVAHIDVAAYSPDRFDL